jgi:hypothetical protein
VLTRVIFLPRELTNWRLVTASTINPFFHRHTDAVIINPDVIWPTARPKNSIQAASHILFLASAGCVERARRTIITTNAIARSPFG